MFDNNRQGKAQFVKAYEAFYNEAHYDYAEMNYYEDVYYDCEIVTVKNRYGWRAINVTGNSVGAVFDEISKCLTGGEPIGAITNVDVIIEIYKKTEGK